MVLTHQMKCVKPSAEGLFYPSTRARENPYYPIYVKNICKNYVIYYVVLDHRIMEVRRFFYKRLVFSDNRCSNRFFLVSAGIFVG